MDLPSVAEDTARPYISTGRLPAPEVVRKYLTDAYLSLRQRCQWRKSLGRRRSPFPPAFRQPSKNEGDT
jgi:hypothetical protein